MTLITGTIKDSGGVLLAGKLIAQLDSRIVDVSTSPDSIVLPVAHEFDIPSGSLSVNLPQSETQNTTYEFKFQTVSTVYLYFFANGSACGSPVHLHTDGQYYTGVVHTAQSVIVYQQANEIRSDQLNFHAIVPNTATCDFADLVATGITTDILDSSIRRLALLLTQDQQFVQILRGSPNWKGDYSAATYYQDGDAVSYGGSSWRYVYADPAVGQTPSEVNTTYWQLIARKGDSGGTGGNDTAYDPTGWNGALDAPSRNAVRDILVTLAPLASPVFTGNPAAPTQPVGTTNTTLATTGYVDLKITDRFSNAVLTNSPTVPTQIDTTRDLKAASTEYVKNVFHRYSKIIDAKSSGTPGGSSIAGLQTRDLNAIANNAGDITSLVSNTFTLRAGTYRFIARAPIYHASSPVLHRLQLFNVTANARLYTGNNAYNGAGSQGFATMSGTITLTVNSDLRLLHAVGAAQATNGLGVLVGESGYSETYSEIEFWRLD